MPTLRQRLKGGLLFARSLSLSLSLSLCMSLALGLGEVWETTIWGRGRQLSTDTQREMEGGGSYCVTEEDHSPSSLPLHNFTRY